MTVVTISVRVPLPDGTLAPAKGSLRWTPTRRRDIGGEVILPHSFTVQLVDGAATVNVEPSTAEWAWQVDEYFVGVSARTIHVAVPTTAAAYTALTQVDPATLLPTAEPEAAWWAALPTDADIAGVIGAVFVVSDTEPIETTRHGVPVVWVDTGDITAPSAVSNLTAGTTTADSIPLSWTAATDNLGIAGYEYSLDGITWVTTGSTGTTYTVTGLTANTSYTVSVRAFDAAGNRGASVAVTAATTAAAPDVTEDFNVANGTSYAGKLTTTGGLAWVDDMGTAVSMSAGPVQIASNQASNGGARLDPTVAVASVSADFVVPSGDANERAALWLLGPASTTRPAFFIQIRGAASGCNVYAFNSAATLLGEAAIATNTGRVALHNNGANAITVTLDGTQILGPFTVSPTAGNKSVGFAVQHGTGSPATPARADNFSVDYA